MVFLVLDWGTIIPVPDWISSCCCLVNVNNNELCHARKACFGTLVDPPCLLFGWCWANVYITNQFQTSCSTRGGGREKGKWAPVLLWNPAILLLQNITKSIQNHANTYFLSSSTPTHMYISIIHTKCCNAFKGIQATTIYSILQQSRKATVYLKGGDNKGCCVQGYKNHKCNTNEGCTYQGQNNQGLHFTGIAINSRDVFFKDRFMLAPN